eukprot:364964-Chlamydomonas_euryale.AAC.8
MDGIAALLAARDRQVGQRRWGTSTPTYLLTPARQPQRWNAQGGRRKCDGPDQQGSEHAGARPGGI